MSLDNILSDKQTKFDKDQDYNDVLLNSDYDIIQEQG
jgi:hypothetical protein